MKRRTRFVLGHTLAYAPMTLTALAVGAFHASVVWVVPAMVCFGAGLILRDYEGN